MMEKFNLITPVAYIGVKRQATSMHYFAIRLFFTTAAALSMSASAVEAQIKV
jgi:hypothetical protein